MGKGMGGQGLVKGKGRRKTKGKNEIDGEGR